MAIKRLLGNHLRLVDSSIVVTAGGAPGYPAGDVVGGLLEFTLPRAIGGRIHQVGLVDDDNEQADLTLWLFDAVPTAFADNAVFAPVVADLQKVVAKVAIAPASYTTVNGNAVALVTVNPASVFESADGKLYGYLVTNGTPTYTATTDLVQVTLDVVVDLRGNE